MWACLARPRVVEPPLWGALAGRNECERVQGFPLVVGTTAERDAAARAEERVAAALGADGGGRAADRGKIAVAAHGCGPGTGERRGTQVPAQPLSAPATLAAGALVAGEWRAGAGAHQNWGQSHNRCLSR